MVNGNTGSVWFIVKIPRNETVKEILTYGWWSQRWPGNMSVHVCENFDGHDCIGSTTMFASWLCEALTTSNGNNGVPCTSRKINPKPLTDATYHDAISNCLSEAPIDGLCENYGTSSG